MTACNPAQASPPHVRLPRWDIYERWPLGLVVRSTLGDAKLDKASRQSRRTMQMLSYLWQRQ
jgi:hypothetical protein